MSARDLLEPSPQLLTRTQFILLLGSPYDYVLLQTRDRLISNDVRVYLVQNVALVNISAPFGVDDVEAKIVIEGESLSIRTAKAILVSQVMAGTKDLMDGSDAHYVEQEVFASWLALLSMAPCRIINRPSARVPVMLYNSIQLRSFARSLGVPTVDEEICSKRELVRRKQRGENLVCLDLSNQQPFCLVDDYRIEGGRLYSIIEVTCDATYAITVRIAEEFLSFLYKPSQGIFRMPDAFQNQLKDSSRTLLDALNLSFAYCVHAFQPFQQKVPEFTRLYTETPPFLPMNVTDTVVDKLIDELKR